MPFVPSESYPGEQSTGVFASTLSSSPNSTIPVEKCHTLEFTGKDAGTTILIQFILAFICAATLVIKYRCESKPRRPCCVWFWDVSKQACGAAFMHLLNLILASILSGSSDSADPCAWYFINITIDTFVGCFLQFFLLETVEKIAVRRGGDRWACLARSGYYGNPPKMSWWAGQLSVYCLLVGLNKCFIFIFVYFAREPLGNFGQWLFYPLHGFPTLELIIVMILAPGLMNAWMFWVTDTFIMMMADPDENRYPAWCCCLCRKAKGRFCSKDDSFRDGSQLLSADYIDEESIPRSLHSSYGQSALTDDYYSAPMLDPAEMGSVGREARDSLEGDGLDDRLATTSL